MQPAAKKEEVVDDAAPAELQGVKGSTLVPKKDKHSRQLVQLVKPEPKAKEERAGPAKTEDEVLKLPLALIQQFAELHLSAPGKMSDVPRTIAALKDKAEFFGAESAKNAEKAREKAAEKAAAAAAAPAAAPAAAESAPATEETAPASE